MSSSPYPPAPPPPAATATATATTTAGTTTGSTTVASGAGGGAGASISSSSSSEKNTATASASSSSSSSSSSKSDDGRQFHIYLCDLQKQMCVEWHKHFIELGKFTNVTIIHGRFEEQASDPGFDCMTSPGNSFGLMDGGVDAYITRFFGRHLMARVQQRIIDDYDGEQPVGTCEIVETGYPKHPFLAHAPTMRVPYSIQGTDYTYLTFKSVLRAVRRHNLANPARPIRKLLCTGLGTFYGKMPLGEAARQMALAHRGFMHPPSSLTWDFASERQRSVGYGGHPGFVKFQRAVAAAAAATASAKANKSKRGRTGAGAAAAAAGDAAASEESRRRIMAEMYKLAAEMETK